MLPREGGPNEDQRGWALMIMWHCQITRGVNELALNTILPSQTHLACACDDFRCGPHSNSVATAIVVVVINLSILGQCQVLGALASKLGGQQA